MYYLDALRDQDGSVIYRTKSGFRYPLSKHRDGRYKVQSGEMLRVCMTSDFFLEEADPWREEAWEIIRQRPDVKFFLLTKRPQRVAAHLPYNWGDGWGYPIPEEKLYRPYFGERCRECGMRLSCNGCSQCGKCEKGQRTF